MGNSQEKVLVTGASGFIALHCIKELLQRNFLVKGSVRSHASQELVMNSITSDNLRANLEFCNLNLLQDEGWEDASSDCDYLIHIASPFSIEEPKNENEFIKPALEGTLRALRAAKKSKLKKVVLTSSMASIAYGHNKSICNNKDWTDVSKNVGAYVKSKTIAEQAAWKFLADESDEIFKMTTIHPGMVFGPLLSNNLEGASVSLIKNLISGKFPALPNVHFTVVDVRDIAKLHVDSLKNKNSDNKRIIATSKSGFAFIEISRLLNNMGYEKSPLNVIPNQVINSLAPFNKEMKNTAAMIKRGSYEVDIEETIKIFNWKPTQLNKTLKDMTDSLKAYMN